MKPTVYLETSVISYLTAKQGIRLEIEAECQNDPQKYYEHIQLIQKQYSNRLVRFKPKPALKLAKVE